MEMTSRRINLAHGTSSTMQLIPGVGHYPQIEAPDELTRLLLAAISSSAA